MNYIIKRLSNLLLAFLLPALSLHAQDELSTTFLTGENGPGSDYVRSIVQTPDGFLWMGTVNGLKRYDGYELTTIAPNDERSRQLMPDNRIQSLRLWQDRYILIRLRDNKFCCYDSKTNQFTEFKGNYQEAFQTKREKAQLPAGIPQGENIRTDNLGNTVVMTSRGELWVVDKSTKKVTHLTGLYSEELTKRNGSPRYAVVTAQDGTIWTSTYGNGLFVHNPKTSTTTHYLKDQHNTAPIQTNYLTNLYEDRTGNIWVCQEYMGVVCIYKHRRLADFIYYTADQSTDHSNSIHLLTRIGENTIYIGNKYNGLKRTDGLLQGMQTASQIEDDIVTMTTAPDGTLWMGTRNTGIYAGEKNYRHDDNQPQSLGKGKLSDLLFDRQGRMWISLFDSGIDLAEPDGTGGYRFRHVLTEKEGIKHPRKLLLDHQGRIWLCANNGIFYFYPDQLLKDPKRFDHLPTNDNETTDEVHTLYEDNQHHIWAGTTGNGVCLFDNSGKLPVRLKSYTVHDGLPDNNVQTIIQDKKGNIWLGTDYGLARYRQQTKEIERFYPASNDLGNMYVENTACLLNDGKIAFGTHHGIAIITPEQMTVRKSQFPLAITNILVNGISYLDEGLTIDEGQRLTLDYHQNSLTFYFADFDFTNERQSKYSYRLEPFDREWSPLSTLNQASYKNLADGSYTLHVRSQNSNGVWNETEVTLNIKIEPPFWRTWWAYLIYISIIAAIGWFVYRHFKRINDLRNKIKVENQLTEYKMRFFANVSHEFRTPLTIIRGAMERIQSAGQVPADMRQPVSVMQKSVGRLLRMINQLMEFSKMHEQKLRLAVEETEVIGFIRDIFDTFRNMAEEKRINYLFSTTHSSYTMLIDRSYLDKIAYNLISNAFKYTPSNRSIKVGVSINNDMMTIRVEDTGIGIEKEKQKELFTRFNQSAFSRDSIGIGLHLTNELVRVHHGTINYQENPEGGSIFLVSLPTDRSVYSSEELRQASAVENDEQEYASLKMNDTYKEMPPVPINRQQILIVEDDNDIRQYLQHEMQHYFVVDTASNGEEALERIRQQKPELIITDVLMPVMNGYELTSQIRANSEWKDIPIIMLTALTTEEKHVKGINAGADAYIEKPFSPRILIARCCQLIEQRDRLKTSYAKEVVGKVVMPEIIIDEQDQKLRDRLEVWMQAHLSDPNINIETFAQSMGYGRTNFFKKVKQLTGMTPNDYIKSTRMTMAAELLKDSELNVSEIAYKIGIEDPYYFSKSFKSYFGISPSQYRKGEKPKEE